MTKLPSAQGRLRSASIADLLFACLGFNSTYNYISSFTQRILGSRKTQTPTNFHLILALHLGKDGAIY